MHAPLQTLISPAARNLTLAVLSPTLLKLSPTRGRIKNSPRRLCLWNTKKEHSICEVNFLTAVLSVKLNRKRVAVCLKTALHVFDISDMKCLRTLETAPNPDGVMALSPNENCHLAFPDGAKAGGAGGGGEVRSGFRRFSGLRLLGCVLWARLVTPLWLVLVRYLAGAVGS